jgi:hypothetical protein
MRYFAGICFVLFCVSCTKRKADYLNSATTNFHEDFETYTITDQLFDPGPWGAAQLTLGDNSITIDTLNVYTGSRALKMSANTTEGDMVSKASIFKNDFGFQEGDRFITECRFHLQCSQPKDFFLLDFEDPAAISSGPGMRLMLNENGALCVERKKMNASTLQQNQGTEQVFPLNTWVHIKIEILLHQRRRGSILVWQNNELILKYDNVQTLPRDLLYITQGTSGILRQIEVGITANSSGAPALLYIDDLKVTPVN